MKYLLRTILITLFFINISCNKELSVNKTSLSIYKGKMLLMQNDMDFVIEIINSNVNLFKTNWENPKTGITYNYNVFIPFNRCEIYLNNLKEGDEFYFTIPIIQNDTSKTGCAYMTENFKNFQLKKLIILPSHD